MRPRARKIVVSEPEEEEEDGVGMWIEESNGIGIRMRKLRWTVV